MAKKEIKVAVSSLLQVNNFIFLLETTKDWTEIMRTDNQVSDIFEKFT